MFLILFSYAILASTFTFGKIALFYFKPFFFIGMRMVLSGILLLGYLLLFQRNKLVLAKKDWWLFAQAILFHIYCTFLGEFWALQYLSSSKACLLYNTSPFLAALFSYVMFRERMTSKKMLGLMIGFMGFLPILMTDSTAESLVGSISFFSFPELVLLCSVVTSVYGWIVVRKLVKDSQYSPFMVNGVAMLGAGILSFATSWLFEPTPILAQSTHDLMIGLGYTGLIILIANILYYNLYGYLLRFYSATWLAFVGFVCPIFAAFYGWILLHESIGWQYFLSIFIVFWGLLLFYKEELRLGYIARS